GGRGCAREARGGRGVWPPFDNCESGPGGAISTSGSTAPAGIYFSPLTLQLLRHAACPTPVKPSAKRSGEGRARMHADRAGALGPGRGAAALMDRRALIASLAGSLAWPLAAWAH